MLASINPLGERARRQHWPVTFGWYVAGSVTGGAVLGALLGAAGAGVAAATGGPSPALTAALTVAVAAAGAALDLGIGGLHVPTLHRQVDENWLPALRGWVYGAGFGFQLGTGVLTTVTTATVYATWALAFLAGSVPAAMVIGTTFGLVRALPLLAVARVRTPSELRRVVRAANAVAPTAARVAAAATTLVAASTAGVLLWVS